MLARTATVAGAGLCALSAALPWVTTGSRTRNAFSLMRALDSAGLVAGGAARGLVVAVALLPVVAAGCWVAASLHRRRLLATLGGAAGAVALIGGVVVLRAPVGAGVGVYLALMGAALSFGGAVALMRQERE